MPECALSEPQASVGFRMPYESLVARQQRRPPSGAYNHDL